MNGCLAGTLGHNFRLQLPSNELVIMLASASD